MKTASIAKKTPRSPRLTREDWLDAAHAAVVEGGFNQVRVLVLADRLKVTRGSFYWHYSDHAELVAALLARWRASESTLAHTLEAAATPDAAADLERLLDAALTHGGDRLGNMSFELALRAQGRRDENVARMLIEVDQQRMQLFERKFERLSGDATTAAELAALFYLAIVGGNQALSRPLGPPRMKEYLKGIIAHYLIYRQAPVARKARRARSKPA